jgi:uncharacterized membrane protein YfcA
MSSTTLVGLLPVLLLIVAFLYASVGHGGASGYLAVMILFGVATKEEMKSSALILNLLVSLVAFWQFRSHFRWSLFWVFAASSIPAAFLGAYLPVNTAIYNKLLALFLIVAVLRLVNLIPSKPSNESAEPNRVVALTIGAIIGLLSGMLGIGGGIILSPVILLFGWADMKQTAAISALFIFVNSLSGFAGLLLKGFQPQPYIYLWLGFAFAGGMLGAYLGSKKMNVIVLRYMLAFVLSIAAVKLFFS